MCAQVRGRQKGIKKLRQGILNIKLAEDTEAQMFL